MRTSRSIVGLIVLGVCEAFGRVFQGRSSVLSLHGWFPRQAALHFPALLLFHLLYDKFELVLRKKKVKSTALLLLKIGPEFCFRFTLYFLHVYGY